MEKHYRTFVQFGAGNIGRSFIGQLFYKAGFRVIYIDIDSQLVHALNDYGKYIIEICDPLGTREELIEGIEAIDGADRNLVIPALQTADFIATSVGSSALGHIYGVIAEGILRRQTPIDIIIAENLRDGAAKFRAGLLHFLPVGFPLDERVGFVETSIGKMVPSATIHRVGGSPLRMYAEPYNTLIVDKRGFITAVPPLPDLKVVDPIRAYVDQKLFVHNLGHAAVAYLGYRFDPSCTFIWQVLENQSLLDSVRNVMRQGSQAVRKAYPGVFTIHEMDDYIEDLIHRFRNRSLGDTIFRVGRDVPRKLGRDDRVTGAMLLASSLHLPFDEIADVYLAALEFSAADDTGHSDKRDLAFHDFYSQAGIEGVFEQVSGLRRSENDLNVKRVINVKKHSGIE